MTPQISAPHFRHILARQLEGYGKPVAYLDVTREGDGPTAIVRVDWEMVQGRRETLSLGEERVIDGGGPEWIARLIMARKSVRKEMMA